MMLRANATADFRAFCAAVIIILLFNVFSDSKHERIMERYFLSGDWITATMRLVPDGEGGFDVDYTVQSLFPVDAVWVLRAIDRAGNEIYVRRGDGNYTPDALTQRRPWSWMHFGRSSLIPAVPDVPFRLCATYVATSDNGVVNRSSAPMCSNYSDEPPYPDQEDDQ